MKIFSKTNYLRLLCMISSKRMWLQGWKSCICHRKGSFLQLSCISAKKFSCFVAGQKTKQKFISIYFCQMSSSVYSEGARRRRKVVQSFSLHVCKIFSNLFPDLSHNPTKYSLPFVRGYKYSRPFLSSHFGRILFCILCKKFWQKSFKGAEVEVGGDGNMHLRVLPIGSTRRQECMEEAAKWQLGKTPCNLDTLSTVPGNTWRVKISSDLIWRQEILIPHTCTRPNSLGKWQLARTTIGASEVAPRL